MQIAHAHAENANFQAVNKNKQMLLSWLLIAYLSIIFLCIAISYEIIETFYTNTNLSFLRTGLTTILNCLVSYKTKKEHSYEFLSYCKIPIPQREFSIIIGSIPSGTHMLGIDKDHSPNSASLDVTNVFFLRKCVFHEVIIKLFVLFFKEKLLLYLMFCLIGTLY